MMFSMNFVKFMGNFCKVFAAYKQVRDSTAFLLSKRWYSAFVVYHNKFLIYLKSFRSSHLGACDVFETFMVEQKLAKIDR